MKITPTKIEVKSSIFGITRAWFWMIMIALTIFGVGTTYWMAKPYWLSLERQAYTASHQYIEARKSALLDLVSQVEKIDVEIARAATSKRGQLRTALVGQRTALVDRMKTEAAKIPTDAVPTRVHRIINGG